MAAQDALNNYMNYSKLEQYLDEQFAQRKDHLFETLKRRPEEFFQILEADRQVLYTLLRKVVPSCADGGIYKDEIRFLAELSSWYANAFLDDSNCEIVYEKLDLELSDYVPCSKDDRFAKPTVVWSDNWDNRLEPKEFLELAKALTKKAKVFSQKWEDGELEIINHN